MRRWQCGIVLTGYVLVVVGLVLTGAGVAVWYFRGEAARVQAELTQVTAALAREEQAREGFSRTALACSQSVDAVAKRAADMAATHARGTAAATARDKVLTGYVNELLTRPPAKDECAGMKEELDAEIDRRAATRGQ